MTKQSRFGSRHGVTENGDPSCGPAPGVAMQQVK